ncbi:sulfur oxidation c-type cytochrome SoxA [Limnohabitans sp. B9-3]|uniref:sulfur oxidation c-type cytochrome SoxA n=1 Tax=Limnohabitans sp. B9-3 TaxID=1100707 RepID=UPI000C1E581F|nr:sulfur oxidation c-type cytochrome SoxA [Limnohabitans sp. B9-3]PIT76225.1 sulfur oxidation c-type cytochrome SoxA [Limnohabitans sp. B9-3]
MRVWRLPRAGILALFLALLLMPSLSVVVHAQTRQSGLLFLTPQLQAMQRDPDTNPISLWRDQGQTLWTAQCSACHPKTEAMKDVATRFPKVVMTNATPELRNLEDQINVCRQRTLQPAKSLEDAETLSLSTYLHAQAQGLAIDVQPPNADSRAQAGWLSALTQGTQLYATRLGRMNLACVHCHDGKVGTQLRAEVISPAHPTGFPIYRLNWQTLGSMDRRLRACYSGVQAQIPAPGSAELRQLELYLKVRANGMPLDGPSIRR